MSTRDSDLMTDEERLHEVARLFSTAIFRRGTNKAQRNRKAAFKTPIFPPRQRDWSKIFVDCTCDSPSVGSWPLYDTTRGTTRYYQTGSTDRGWHPAVPIRRPRRKSHEALAGESRSTRHDARGYGTPY